MSLLPPASPTTRLLGPKPVAPWVGNVIVALVIAAIGPIIGFWIAHGDLTRLTSIVGQLTALGHVTGLVGAYAALVQLVLMSRNPWLDRTIGMDRVAVAHRKLGFATVALVVVHAMAATTRLTLEAGASFLTEVPTVATTYPFMLLAFASLALFLLVAMTSMRAARRRLSYESWLGIHAYAYLAIVLGFGHQLFARDFVNDVAARAYWVGLYALAAGLVVIFRVAEPVVRSRRHDLRVGAVVKEGNGVVSVYMVGRAIAGLPAEAGQYLQWRFLTPRGWWRTHPFSLSAAPNGRFLRITVKSLGEDSSALASVPVGTRVWFEGPYGAMTPTRRCRSRVVLIAAGIGISPIRALFEALPGAPGDVDLIYRANTFDEAVLREEIDAIARARGDRVHYIVGRRGVFPVGQDPLGPAEIRRLVPDVSDREAYLCGPSRMMQSVEAALARLGVPPQHVHAERFAY
jgi:predicted ferric reductase